MPRFLTLADVREMLNISADQAYRLVKSGELPALKLGDGKGGQWRVEVDELEAFIARGYQRTRAAFDNEGSEPAHHQER